MQSAECTDRLFFQNPVLGRVVRRYRAASRMRANGCGGLAEKYAEKKCLNIFHLRHTATRLARYKLSTQRSMPAQYPYM